MHAPRTVRLDHQAVQRGLLALFPNSRTGFIASPGREVLGRETTEVFATKSVPRASVLALARLELRQRRKTAACLVPRRVVAPLT